MLGARARRGVVCAKEGNRQVGRCLRELGGFRDYLRVGAVLGTLPMGSMLLPALYERGTVVLMYWVSGLWCWVLRVGEKTRVLCPLLAGADSVVAVHSWAQDSRFYVLYD